MASAFTPRPEPPGYFSRRSFSFAVEFYRSMARSHRWLLWVFTRIFPNPLGVRTGFLRRLVGTGGLVRGDAVIRDGVQGRLVGRHPVSGAPVVAWNPQDYPAMCEAFDTENAARIVAWQESMTRLTLTTARCTERALRLDGLLRGMVGIITATSLIAGAVGGLLEGGLLTAALWALLGSISGMLVALPMLLLVAVIILIGIRLLSVSAGLWVGVWARQARERAMVTDEAAHLSAEAIVAAMQGRSVEDDETVQRTARRVQQSPEGLQL